MFGIRNRLWRNLQYTNHSAFCLIASFLLFSCTSLFEGSSNNSNNSNNPSTPISIGPHLVPGNGFSGPTQEPGQIGTGTAKAIARFDVVPYQTITADKFNIGVVAFHKDGIDRIEFSLEDGPWTAVNTMALNNQVDVNVVEYFATLDRKDFSSDGPIEIRAIAYPTSGYPRLLEPLRLYVDAGELQPQKVAYASANSGKDSNAGTINSPVRTTWKAAQIVAAQGGGNADGGIVYLDEGTYEWAGRPGGGAVPQTSDQYLTFRPKPGAEGEQVRFKTGPLPDSGIKLVHFYDVTLIDTVHGISPGWNGSNNGDVVWLDHSRARGPGRDLFGGQWTVDWSDTYWTNVSSTDAHDGVPFNGWLRNVHCQRTISGAGWPRFVANSTWDVVNSGTTQYHADLFYWHIGPNIDNAIIYGVRATNVDASIWQMTGDNKHFKNIAAVNVLMQGGNIGFIRAEQLEHLLMWNVTYTSFFEWQMPKEKGNNVSIRASVFDSMGPNSNYNASVDDAWFDNNHYNFGSFTPGTNITTGNPSFDANFAPFSDSPLLWSNRQHLVSQQPSATATVDANSEAWLQPTIGAYNGAAE